MDGADRGRRWRRLKQRLGLKGIGCFGASLGLPPSTTTVRGDDDDDDEAGDEAPRQHDGEEHAATEAQDDSGRDPPETAPDRGCAGRVPPAPAEGMNLATALAAERNFRAAEVVAEVLDGGTAPGTPRKVSLMRLLEETGGGDEGGKGGVGGSDSVCCVCMVRKKGAAFIPCGHTYCRVCSREVWLNRGSCPLCNRSILEILDIF